MLQLTSQWEWTDHLEVIIYKTSKNLAQLVWLRCLFMFLVLCDLFGVMDPYNEIRHHCACGFGSWGFLRLLAPFKKKKKN